jgi:hypothetical protein
MDDGAILFQDDRGVAILDGNLTAFDGDQPFQPLDMVPQNLDMFLVIGQRFILISVCLDLERVFDYDFTKFDFHSHARAPSLAKSLTAPGSMLAPHSPGLHQLLLACKRPGP